MEEASGKVQKASTHMGSIGVDIAAAERDVSTVDVDATSTLPNKGGARFRSVPRHFLHQAMGWFHGVGSDQLTACEHIRERYVAHE